MSPAPDGGEAVRAQRVTADVDPAQPGPGQQGGHLGQRRPVGRERDIVEPERREPLDEGGDVLAHERLAARQADERTPSPRATRATRVISSKLRRSSC